MKSHSESTRSRQWTRPLAIFTLLLSLPASAFATALPVQVTQALDSGKIPLHNVAIMVQGIDEERPLLSHNAKQPMNPASVMKLLTTYAALDLLGPAYAWKTEALSNAPLLNGQIDGNLYLRGSGDPALSQEQLWLFLHKLRARGLRRIDGDVVLDRSAFDLPPHDPAGFDNKPLRPYNVGPDALMVNLDSLTLTLQPSPSKNTVSVIVETPDDALRIHNRIKPTNDSCNDWRDRIKVSVGKETIDLAGEFPAACGEKSLHLSPWTADEQFGRLFRTIWREVGGSLNGKVQTGKTSETATLLAEHTSPTLVEIVRSINKFSNNVMARQVFLTLDNNRPATPEGARQRIQSWLSAKRIELPGLIIDNGSGLSREARISADGLAHLLLSAWTSPVMPELIASLPIAGIDGTLKKRLNNGVSSGRAHLKTGYLEGVRSIAGFVMDRHGKRWIVVFLINDANSRNGKPAVDALLEWVAEH